MKRRLMPILLGLISASWGMAANEPGARELVPLLGDEDYPTRVKASQDLWALGEKARAELEQAVGDGNPEIAARARDVLRKVQLGILPGSPPEVVALVVSYDGAGIDQRRRIIRELRGLRAWRQMLKIYELEKDPETLRRIAPEMAGVAVEAAREVLVAEPPDFDAAREYLEMGRAEPQELMSLAAFHRMAGTLDEELKRAKSLKGRAGQLWRYSLHAAAGRTLEAAREVEAAGDDLVGARLRLLTGDPVPWLRRARVPFGQIPPGRLDLYRDAVLRVWSGEGMPDRLVDGLVKEVNRDENGEGWNSLAVLFALGEYEVGEPLYARYSPVEAASYFDTVERVGEAFAAIGLEWENPDLESWVRERFQVLIHHPDDVSSEVEELSFLGSFLERRGRSEELAELFVKPLRELSRENPETFMMVIQSFFPGFNEDSASYPSPLIGPVLEACMDFAGDDEGRWAMVRESLFGEENALGPLWEEIGLSDPAMSRGDRMWMMVTLLGMAPDPDDKGGRWWEERFEAAGEGRPGDRLDRLGLLLSLSSVNPDAERFLKAAEMAAGLDGDLSTLGVLGSADLSPVYENCLTTAGRWDELAELRNKAVEQFPGNPMLRAQLAAALAQAGDSRAAKFQEEMLERLILGDTASMYFVGLAYSFAGLSEKAYEWWTRGLKESAESNRISEIFMTLIARESLEMREWSTAAAMIEADLLAQVMSVDPAEGITLFQDRRVKADIARALSEVDGGRAKALGILERVHRSAPTHPAIADHFFPAVREAGLTELHDRCFEESWKVYSVPLERFPDGDNTANTAAWVASRANRRLDEAEVLSKRSLELRPGQAAYLDTMGEIWFARRDRKKAVEWSSQAINRSPGVAVILHQHERFRRGPYPAR